jgi:hypothetical protein
MNATSIAGLIVMIVSQTATIAGIEPFWSWNTPICWTGFILFADGMVFRARRASWLRSMPGEFALLAALSIPLWLVFELYNRFIHNWYYVGLPENRALRMFGYAWSFATIWPAIFEGAELVGLLRADKTENETRNEIGHDGPAFPAVSTPLIVAGAAMLIAPLVAPAPIASYLAAPVWLGFACLLDPLNARAGCPSILADGAARRYDRLIDLLLSGLLCGLLWEFWNYWAGAKWHYTVPFLNRIKLFEMPLPGYLGFPPFAVECFAMYVFVRGRGGRLRCNFPLGTL